MGYNTDFKGKIKIEPSLTEEQINIINDFSNERHDEPEYPGIWCQWIVDKNSLFWDGNEKFYNYVEWLEYLIKTYFTQWNCKLNGQLFFDGEEIGDIGYIKVIDNVVYLEPIELFTTC